MANILIVEDNDDVAGYMAGVLQDAGHHVDRSAAAYGAIIRACKINYDLIIMDLLLQGANGAVAALALKGLGSTASIVIITGGVMPIDEEVFERAQFAGKLLKPVMPAELLKAVNQYLGLPTTDEELKENLK